MQCHTCVHSFTVPKPFFAVGRCIPVQFIHLMMEALLICVNLRRHLRICGRYSPQILLIENRRSP